MDKKTVLVASRHPHLEDVRRHVLEHAGYQVVTTQNPEQVEEACKTHKIDLVVIGYSITPAEKGRIAAEATAFCGCPILELWDRHPPQRRGEYPVIDHFSLLPEDFLDTVNSILGRTPQISPLCKAV
jgi:DNA-binding NarL/FixJ family response regulator